MDYDNNIEIRVVNLARSGSHALINWVIGLCSGKICFLNSVKPFGSPFENYTEKELVNINEDEFYLDKNGKFTKKDFLIYSYEEYPLDDVFNLEFEKNHDKYVGKSKKRFDVMIFRDPFNFFASRIKLEEYGILSLRIHLVDEKSKKLVMKMWKDYAKEFLGYTKYMNQNKIGISYNQWFLDKSYKRVLAKKFGLPFKDLKDKYVSKYGPGSSFDGRKFDGKANEMKVLDRWKVFGDYPFYRSIFQDKELLELSNKIFGKIEGVNVLHEPQSAAQSMYNSVKFGYQLIKGRLRYHAKKIIFECF